MFDPRCVQVERCVPNQSLCTFVLRIAHPNYEESTRESYVTILAEKDVLLRHPSSIPSQSQNQYC
jgi:hypothetical protein